MGGYDQAHRALWAAVCELAQEWRLSPTVRKYCELAFPASPTELSTKMNELSSLMLMKQPLFRHSGLYTARLQAPHFAPYLVPFFSTPAFVEFNELAGAVEIAAARLLTFVRSRLPGYPSIMVPQLARGSIYTTEELSYTVPWLRRDFALGLQRSGMIDLAPFVGLHSGALRETLACLVEAVISLPEFIRFRELHRTLEPHDRSLLQEQRRRLRDKLSCIDSIAGQRATERLDFRRSVTLEAVDNLSGRALEYCNAFSEVDSVIYLSVVDVFGQLVAHGSPSMVDEFSDFTFDGRIARCTTSQFIEVGSLCIFHGAVVDEVCLVDLVQLHFEGQDGAVELKARKLAGFDASLVSSALF